MRFAVFWDFLQRKVVARYPHFATAYRTHLQVPSSTNISLQPIGPETLVRNYHIKLRKIPKERKISRIDRHIGRTKRQLQFGVFIESSRRFLCDFKSLTGEDINLLRV